MALAILEFLSITNGQVKFKIDTGTNEYYYVKIGDKLTEKYNVKWVDEVLNKTPLKKNEKANTLFNTTEIISLPQSLFPQKSCYAQLFSFKNSTGRSPAFSGAVRVPISSFSNAEIEFSLSNPTNSLIENKMENIYLNNHRLIPHKTAEGHFSKQTSFEDILANVVRVAGPIVMGLISGLQNNPAAGAAASSAPGAGTSSIPSLGMLNTILDSLLHGIGGNAAPSPSAPIAAAPVVATPVSTTHSLAHPFTSSRFLHSQSTQSNFSKPFIFGIDDALIASLVGPVLQVLPQLVNANNQAKLQNKQANNQLVSDLVGQVNRRMMLQQFLQNQAAQPSGSASGLPPGINVEQLLQLLQQATPTAPATVAATAPVVAPAVAASLSIANKNYITTLSTKTILSFETKENKNYCEKDMLVFKKNTAIKLKIKLNVPEPAPKNALPRAIVKFVFKENGTKTIFEKIYKQKNVLPNTVLEFDFSIAELQIININTPIMVIAEMKWLTSSNKEVKSFGSTEIVLVDNYFLKMQGKEMLAEKELTDMKTYRAFWNKLWESPLLDKINKNEDGFQKFRWRLETSLKYTVLLSPNAEANGLMETKLLKAENELETLSENIQGRIKGGIELSIVELNKMITLWDNQVPLNPEKLVALKTNYFAIRNSADCVSSIKMTGKNKERGLLWVVPTLQLYNLIICKVKNVDECGQVVESEEETILFPLPKSLRVLGLKSI